MPIFNNLFSTKEQPVQTIEFKSYALRNAAFEDLLARIGASSNSIKGGKISPAAAMHYYESVPSVFASVNTIAREGANIQPLIFDTEENKVAETPETDALLTLLNFPNTDVSGEEFVEQNLSFFKATGNAFILAQGKVNF